MEHELSITSDFLRRLIFKMRALSLGDEDTPRDARDNAQLRGHHITLSEEVGTDPSRTELINEIEAMESEHQHELVALMWVGRGDFDADDWPEALALAADRAEGPTSKYLLSHPMAADEIVGGLETLGHDHVLQDGNY